MSGGAAPSLARASARGAVWNVGAQLAAQLSHLAVRVALARLLAPRDFGVVAMAMSVVSFSWWFIDLSFGQALIQRRELTEQHRSTAFWSQLLAGGAVFCALAAAAPLVARFYDTPELSGIVVALGATVVLAAPEASFAALLQRELRFREIAVRRIGAVAAGGTAGIWLALSGAGAWALVAYAVVSAGAGAALLGIQSTWRPRLLFSGAAFRELWAFSGHLIGARLVNYSHRNADTILIGRFLGAAALGTYNIGYQFVLLPLAAGVRALGQVLYSALARLQGDPGAFAAASLLTLGLIATAVFPLMTIAALSAPVLLPAVLGPRWGDAVPIVPAMCLAGAMQSLHAQVPSIHAARGASATALRWSCLAAGVNVAAICAGLPGGIGSVATAYAAANALLAAVMVPLLLAALGARARAFLGIVAFPLAGSLAIVLLWRLPDAWTAGAPPLLVVGLKAALAATAYAFLAWRHDPETAATVKRLLFTAGGPPLAAPLAAPGEP